MSMHGPFFQFEPPSEEEQARINDLQEKNRMRLDEFYHAHQRLFEELDLDQLQSLKQMFNFIVQSTNSPMAASWEGMIAHALKVRFNICITCNVDHDKEVIIPEQSKEQEPTPVPVAPPLPTDEIGKGDREIMKVYHLDDAYDDNSHKLIGFLCTGIEGANGPCGSMYPSIADRILRGPEHCEGCFIKMGHG
jgi:hypothetical protein